MSAELRTEIIEKLINPFRQTGISDNKCVRLATPIAKKFDISLDELFDIYWKILLED